jgi:hypothetical protein
MATVKEVLPIVLSGSLMLLAAPAILLFMLAGILVALPYQVWSRKHAVRRPAVVEG